MPERDVTIVNRRGLHARAAAKFVKLASGFDAEVVVEKEGMRVSGLSLMGLLMLAASPGSQIRIETEGAAAAEALDALGGLVDCGFEEKD
ncbi:MAG: HPr family phosphocarrier protein [Rhodospirillales bacterium]